MGYDTRLFIGSVHSNTSTGESPEYANDTDNPYADGSGFPYKKNPDGSYVRTGRIKKWLHVYAMLDLYVIGSHGPLLDLIYSVPDQTYDDCKEFVYCYDNDGNSCSFHQRI